jgi:hypothetical protein
MADDGVSSPANNDVTSRASSLANRAQARADVMRRYRAALLAMGATPLESADDALRLYGRTWVLQVSTDEWAWGYIRISADGDATRQDDCWQVHWDDAELTVEQMTVQVADFWHHVFGCKSQKPATQWCAACRELAAEDGLDLPG